MFKKSLSIACFIAITATAQAAAPLREAKGTRNPASSRSVNFEGVYDLISTDPAAQRLLCAASIVIRSQCGGYRIYTNYNTVEDFCSIEEETRNPPFPDRNPPFPDRNPPFPDYTKPIVKGGKNSRVIQNGNTLMAINEDSRQVRTLVLKNDILYKQSNMKFANQKCVYQKR